VICGLLVKPEVAVINDTTERQDAMWDYRKWPPPPGGGATRRNALTDLLASVEPQPTPQVNNLLAAALSSQALPSGIRVRNLVGTSRNTCRCRSWREHWAKYMGMLPTYCSVSGCLGAASVGGHVLKVGSWDRDWYIVPLCHACNSWDGDLMLPVLTGLAPAKVSTTCGG
jgi:hypothetical protein